MDTEGVRRLWSATLGGDVDWQGLSAEASYRALTGPTELEPRKPRAGSGVPPGEPSGYRALGELGRGGMGVVWRARQSSLLREVALKGLPEGASPEARQMFLAEARLTGWLEHPNIVPVHDLLDAQAARPFLAMKLVAGQSWASQLPAGPVADLDPQLEILSQVCHAVAFAHSRGVVHLDLKPDNVMVGAFGEVQVMDWGLAVELEARPETPRHRLEIASPCGTPAYMPPELANGLGERIGTHTDVYLLGGILCRLLSGHGPHGGRPFVEAVTRAAIGAAPELPMDAPAELAALCRRALEGDPEARMARVEDFQAALRAYLRHGQSLAISARAEAALSVCQERAGDVGASAHQLYSGFAEAVAGFREARRLWEANTPALEGEQRARRAWAAAALAHDDLGLAEAQLVELGAEAAPALCARLSARRRQLELRERGRRRLKTTLWGLSLAFGLLLVVGMVFFAAKNAQLIESSRRVKDAQALERSQREKAEEREKIARDMVRRLLGEVHSKLTDVGDRHTHAALAKLLVVAIDGLEGLARSNPESGDYLWDIARARFFIGDAKRRVFGDPDAARKELTTAVSLLTGTQASALAMESRQGLLDLSCWQLAQLALECDSLDVAERWHQRALDDAQQVLSATPGSRAARVTEVNHLAGMAELRRLQGGHDAARALYRRAWDAFGELCNEVADPLELGIVFELFRGAVAFAEVGELALARTVAEQGLARARQRVERVGESTNRQLDLSLALHICILVCELSRDVPRWAALSDEMVAVLRPVSQRDAGNKAAAVNLATALHHQVRCLRAQGRRDAAEEPLSEVTRLGRELCQRYPQDSDLVRDLSFRLAELAELRWTRGELGAALPLLEECLRLRRRLADGARELRLRRELCLALRDLARLLIDLGDVGRALQLLSESVGRMQPLLEEFPGHPQVRFDLSQDHESLARAYAAVERHQEAAGEHSEGARIRQELWQETGLPLYRAAWSESLAQWGLALASLGERARATALLKQALELAEARLGDDPQDLDALRMRGSLLQGLGMLAWEDGEPLTCLAYLERAAQELEPLREQDARAGKIWQAGQGILQALVYDLLEAGLLEPRNAGERMLAGHMLADRADFAAAVAAFAAAEAEGGAARDAWLTPAFAAGQAHARAAPDAAPAFAAHGLRWLHAHLQAGARERAAGDRDALAHWQHLRDAAPELESLRALPAFRRLFESESE